MPKVIVWKARAPLKNVTPLTTPPPEEEPLPAGLREAVLSGSPWSEEPADFETEAREE